MEIKVLGSGCMNCQTLEKRVYNALQELDLDASVDKVQDVQAIASYGVLRTPGLVIDGKVVSAGSVPTVGKIKELILASRNA